jgi:hypothetical protein
VAENYEDLLEDDEGNREGFGEWPFV